MTMLAEKAPELPNAEAENKPIGRIVSVSGSQAVVLLKGVDDGSKNQGRSNPEIGNLLKLNMKDSIVLALVSALSVPMPTQRLTEEEVWIAELEIVGELITEKDGSSLTFRRGVSTYPALGDPVYIVSRDELAAAYFSNSGTAVNIGKIQQDTSIPAMIEVDELLGKHFAILGTTGTGKSCTVALILRTILQDNPEAHVLLLDPHNEYTVSFQGNSEVITPDDLHLPYWFLTFEEIVAVLVRDGSTRNEQIEILSELIPVAKSQYGKSRNRPAQSALRKNSGDSRSYTVDTPVPYRLSDLVSLIEDRMGMLEHKNDIWPMKQIKQRIEAISQDQRYAFMFGSLTVQDQMAEVLGRLFRIPVNGKPITILQLTGLPSEIVNVVVSVLCRMTFDFGLWSRGKIPLTLVCEEAHRYIPNDPTLGFEPTRRSISRVAKEGRKYGVSLCIVSQRPSELDSTILSQCNTIFAMRMSNDRDQQIVAAAVSECASGMLDFLPSIGTGEAIAFGDGVPLPVRIVFNRLSADVMPRSQTALFTERWRTKIENKDFLHAVVESWRAASSSAIILEEEAATARSQEELKRPLQQSSVPVGDPAGHAQNLQPRPEGDMQLRHELQQSPGAGSNSEASSDGEMDIANMTERLRRRIQNEM